MLPLQNIRPLCPCPHGRRPSGRGERSLANAPQALVASQGGRGGSPCITHGFFPIATPEGCWPPDAKIFGLDSLNAQLLETAEFMHGKWLPLGFLSPPLGFLFLPLGFRSLPLEFLLLPPASHFLPPDCRITRWTGFGAQAPLKSPAPGQTCTERRLASAAYSAASRSAP